MTQGEWPAPRWWTALNVAVLLFFAVVVVHPGALHSIFMVLLGLVLLPVYFFVLVRREAAAPRGNVPLKELYRRLKAGRGLPRGVLETAVVLAAAMAAVRMMTSS